MLVLVRALGSRLGHGLAEVTLTTNGSLLHQHAAALADAGVRRINVSLDTLDADTFRTVTRGGRLEATLAGIDAAARAGMAVRINTVALRGINDREFDALIRWCGDRGHDLCLIETMPMGLVEEDRTDRFLSLTTVRRRLGERWTLVPSGYRTGGPARYASIKETGGRIGFITPMTHEFCGDCNRVRVSCTGRLFLCLGQEDGTDLRAVLRGAGVDADAALEAAIREAVSRKPKGHDFVIERGRAASVDRHMSVTGG